MQVRTGTQHRLNTDSFQRQAVYTGFVRWLQRANASMKSLRPRPNWARQCLGIGLAICLILSHPDVSASGQPAYSDSQKPLAATSFRAALDAAWQRSLQAAESRGRVAIAQADQLLSQSLIAAAPGLSLGQREVLAGSSNASRETEIGLSLPLWWPGQRELGARTAESASNWARAFEDADRLRLAGQLREALAAVHLAESELEQSLKRVDTLGKLAEDVERRVAAGDLAPADAMAARAEWFAAQAQSSAASRALNDRKGQWQLLTGMETLNFKPSSAPSQTQVPDVHPELVLARATVDLGQGRADLIRIQRNEPPQLALGLRQEQPAQGSGSQSSLGLSIRVPIAGERYQRPRLARALGELDAAQTQAARVHARLNSNLALAQRELAETRTQLALAEQRSTLLAERTRLIEQSFKAGETALPEMLRALASAAEAESVLARQRISYQLAIARLEQALGLLP